MEISVPPLRERRNDNDIVPLVHHFLAQAYTRFRLAPRSVDPSSLAALLKAPWPGNVRELKHVVDRAVLLNQEDPLVISLSTEQSASQPLLPEKSLPLETVEERHILRVLEACHDNRSAAEKILGIDRSTLLARLKKIGSSS